MEKNWFDSKVKEFSSIGGYQKPQLNENSLKLDSNENYVLSKQFQNDIVSGFQHMIKQPYCYLSI